MKLIAACILLNGTLQTSAISQQPYSPSDYGFGVHDTNSIRFSQPFFEGTNGQTQNGLAAVQPASQELLDYFEEVKRNMPLPNYPNGQGFSGYDYPFQGPQATNEWPTYPAPSVGSSPPPPSFGDYFAEPFKAKPVAGKPLKTAAEFKAEAARLRREADAKRSRIAMMLKMAKDIEERAKRMLEHEMYGTYSNMMSQAISLQGKAAREELAVSELDTQAQQMLERATVFEAKEAEKRPATIPSEGK